MKTNLLVRAFHECTTGPSVICVNGKWMVGKWLIGYYNYNPLLDRHELFSYDDIQCYVHIVVPETIGRFTGLYDNTKWDELTRDEMSAFLHTKKADGKYNSMLDWRGRMVFENDIVQYHLDAHQYDCQSTVHFGTYLQDASMGEYGGALCYAPFVMVDNIICLDEDSYGPEYFPEYEKEDNLYRVLTFHKAVVIGDIHSNPEFLSDATDYIKPAEDKPTL